MNTLTVWRFDDPRVAAKIVPRLEREAAAGVIHVDDAALVSWSPGRRKPSAEPLGSLTGPGALWGGFWGLLLGLIFLTRIAGPTFGAGAGALGGAMSDFGIDDSFVKDVRDVVTAGSSALFVITSCEVADLVAASLEELSPQMVRCTFSPQNDQWLRDALGEEAEQPIRHRQS